jgi:phage shock protein A
VTQELLKEKNMVELKPEEASSSPSVKNVFQNISKTSAYETLRLFFSFIYLDNRFPRLS